MTPAYSLAELFKLRKRTSDNAGGGGGGGEGGGGKGSERGLDSWQLWFKWRYTIVFNSCFTRCKSSWLLIDKISLNLGNQGWRLRSKTDTSEYDMIFKNIWKWFLEVKIRLQYVITSSASMFFERSPLLDFFALTWFFYLIKPASSPNIILLLRFYEL